MSPRIGAFSFPSWMDSANCASVDIDLFYMEPRETDNSMRARTAIKVCNACPVRKECLEWAFEINDSAGILGGKTPSMRRKMINDHDLVRAE